MAPSIIHNTALPTIAIRYTPRPDLSGAPTTSSPGAATTAVRKPATPRTNDV
jgi:hypothetical protein